MSWPEKAGLVVLGIAALVALTVWLLLTLAGRMKGRHGDKTF